MGNRIKKLDTFYGPRCTFLVNFLWLQIYTNVLDLDIVLKPLTKLSISNIL